MRKLVLPIMVGISVLATATMAVAGPSPFDTKSSAVISIAVYGDSPYGTSPTDDSQLKATPAFINSINADPDISLVLHVGDIHAGQQYCTEAYDRAIYDLWRSFRAAVVYTPGDNEWADCHKPGEGGGLYNKTTNSIDYVLDANGNPVDYEKGDPAKNLDLVRSIFFANPGFAIADRKLLLSQSQISDNDHPNDANYVENVMWEQSKVLFVTLNIPGGSNNDSDIWYKTPNMSTAQSQEIADRTAADLRWLDRAFDRATADGAKAMVIQTQADMWDLDGKIPGHIANYLQFIDKIAVRAKAFAKPVLLFNGDSHVYRSDNPLVPGAPCFTEASIPGAPDVSCPPVVDANSNTYPDAYATQKPNLDLVGKSYNVLNFHRVVVHGKSFPLEWLKLTVDPRANTANGANAFGPFSWKRMIQQ